MLHFLPFSQRNVQSQPQLDVADIFLQPLGLSKKRWCSLPWLQKPGEMLCVISFLAPRR